MCTVWAARYLHSTGKRTLMGSFSHGSMANAMPQAIGCCLHSPQRQVIAFCGDGGISMLLGDLITIAQYNLPVKLRWSRYLVIDLIHPWIKSTRQRAKFLAATVLRPSTFALNEQSVCLPQ